MPISSIWASRSITGLPSSQLPTLQITLPRALSKVTSPYSSRSFAAVSAAEPSAPDTPAAEQSCDSISNVSIIHIPAFIKLEFVHKSLEMSASCLKVRIEVKACTGW